MDGLNANGQFCETGRDGGIHFAVKAPWRARRFDTGLGAWAGEGRESFLIRVHNVLLLLAEDGSCMKSGFNDATMR